MLPLYTFELLKIFPMQLLLVKLLELNEQIALMRYKSQTA